MYRIVVSIVAGLLAAPAVTALAQTPPAPPPPAAAPQAAPKPAPKPKPKAAAKPAARPPAPPADQAAQIPGRPCVGVMSAVGDTFTLRKIGITVFGNENNRAAIESWGIDDFVVRKITAALSGRWNVKRLAYSKAALSAYENADGNIFRDYKGELRKILQAAAVGQGCVRHIVVMKTSTQVGNSNQDIFGLGILEAGGLFSRPLNLYAAISMTVYDGQTFQDLEYKLVREERGFNPFSFKAVRGLTIEVDQSWWPNPAHVGADARLRDATRSLVDRGLTVTLPDLLSDAKL